MSGADSARVAAVITARRFPQRRRFAVLHFAPVAGQAPHQGTLLWTDPKKVMTMTSKAKSVRPRLKTLELDERVG